jgi:hypothetical protein
VNRFHSPELLEKIQERNVLTEKLFAASNQAFAQFLKYVSLLEFLLFSLFYESFTFQYSDMNESYHKFRDVVNNLAIFDCLLSMGTLFLKLLLSQHHH